jgi:hypothetical protein
MKFLDAGTKEGGDMNLSPHTAPALSDDDAALFWRYHIGGARHSGGVTPLSVQIVTEHFSRAKKTIHSSAIKGNFVMGL